MGIKKRQWQNNMQKNDENFIKREMILGIICIKYAIWFIKFSFIGLQFNLHCNQKFAKKNIQPTFAHKIYTQNQMQVIWQL